MIAAVSKKINIDKIIHKIVICYLIYDKYI